jgi:hypothetical protein
MPECLFLIILKKHAILKTIVDVKSGLPSGLLQTINRSLCAGTCFTPKERCRGISLLQESYQVHSGTPTPI